MLVQRLAPDAVIRNYARAPLTRKELDTILKAAASTQDVMNTRHRVAKEGGWKEAPPSKSVFLQAALAENNLLRRPILLTDGALVVGKDLDAIRAALA